MPKKDKLVAGRKIPRPKRQAHRSLYATSARAGGTESLRITGEQFHLLQGILQSTSDGILAVNQENEVLFANERFAEMWMIPQEIMASKDDSLLLQYVLDQLSDPKTFLRRVQELYGSAEDKF